MRNVVIDSRVLRFSGKTAPLLGLLLFPPVAAVAESYAIEAKVVMARMTRAYIVTRDSTVFEPGVALSFHHRGKQVASGRVFWHIDGEMIAVDLDTGSLQGIRRLDRVKIFIDPIPRAARSTLRIGFPSSRRENLLFACRDPQLPSSFLASGYQVDSSGRAGVSWVRRSEPRREFLWPDTLITKTFDEIADQEIALERGELDIAVFWPGELSTRLREHRRWAKILSLPTHGFIGAAWAAGDSVPSKVTIGAIDSTLAALNRTVFRGDLIPWVPVSSRADSAVGRRPKYRVDPSWPGHDLMERFLNRDAERARAVSEVRLFYVDAPASRADSVIRSLPPEAGLVFAIGCPVICDTRLRAYATALGTVNLARLIECRAREARP